jgi:hypothetical protein
MARELEIEGQKDCLHVREDRRECEEPHLDEVRDQTLVWRMAECLVKR